MEKRSKFRRIKNAGLLAGMLATAGLSACGPKAPLKTETNCEVYQGDHYSNSGDPTRYVFDPAKYELRRGGPRFQATSSMDLRDLTIGEKYCFAHTAPNSDGLINIVSINPDTTHYSDYATQSDK